MSLIRTYFLSLALLINCVIINSSCNRNSDRVKLRTPSIQVDFYHSKSASYIHFLRAGFGEPHTSKSMVEIIEEAKISGFKRPENVKLFRKFWDFLGDGFDFESLPTRPESYYGEDALIEFSILNPQIDGFEKHIPILMPFDGVSAYFELKDQLYDKFEKTFWSPAQSQLKMNLNSLNEVLEQTNFVNLLDQVKLFYGSVYPINLPLRVALVPIADGKNLKKKHTSAQSIRNLQIVPYLLSSGIEGNLDVIFHEFCHTLYLAQDFSLKKRLESFFFNSDHSHAPFVYRYLNESLATALGSGIFFKKLKGHYSEKSWYDDKYINGLAKAYAPLVESYLKSKKTIDDGFLEQLLVLAYNTFPNAPFELSSNMLMINVISLDKSMPAQDIARSFQKSFKVQSLYSSDEFGEEQLRKITESNQHSLILLTQKNSKLPPALAHFLNGADKNRRQDFYRKSGIHIFPLNGRFIFWINRAKNYSLDSVITNIKTLENLPKGSITLRL